MEREIKFRYILKHKGKIKIVYATLSEIEQGKMDEYLMQKSAKFRGEDELIARERYIERKDKSGKEIYDGDIVMLRQKSIMKNCRIAWYRSNNFRIVEWKESRAYCGYNIGNSPEKYEVIGNIHEEKNRKGEELKNDRGDDSGKYEGDREN